MRFAYADPPYIGYSHYYKDDPDHAEVDHNQLMKQMCQDYDGWALSCYSNSLKTILTLESCPDNVRIGSWVKPFCSFKFNVNPAYAWEPVIFWNGRKRGTKRITVRDWVSCNMTLERGTIGAKPMEFCRWIFEMLGILPGDEFVDLFPGSGAVTKAWEEWSKQMKMV